MGDTNFRRTGRRTAKGPFRKDERERRRKEGEERNALWAALSPHEQAKVLTSRPGHCKKQRKKLG